MKDERADRLEAHVEYDAMTGCWLWASSTTPCGYGKIRIGGKLLLAHRVSYSETVGPIPEGMFVLHRCDTPACINPDHLRAGTHKENMADMRDKGRAGRKGATKLTSLHISRIKQHSHLSQRKAARLLGHSIPTIKQHRIHDPSTPAERAMRRFFEKVEMDPNSGCWLWTGALLKGYGRIADGPKTYAAHRVSYEALVGDIPRGFRLSHKCGLDLCVNPDHLLVRPRAAPRERTRE